MYKIMTSVYVYPKRAGVLTHINEAHKLAIYHRKTKQRTVALRLRRFSQAIPRSRRRRRRRHTTREPPLFVPANEMRPLNEFKLGWGGRTVKRVTGHGHTDKELRRKKKLEELRYICGAWCYETMVSAVPNVASAPLQMWVRSVCTHWYIA